MLRPKVASNTEWKKWGTTDPLYGVASWQGRQIGGDNPWTNRDFYLLGASDWDDFLGHWRRYGVDTRSCLEIGCGAGRITKHLAATFGQTYALDVSEGMIEYAKRNIKGLPVQFLISDGINIPLPPASVSAVFSTHVFQHFDARSHATAYFQQVARVLQPGGSMMIHLPIYQWPTFRRLFECAYEMRRYVTGLNASFRRLLMAHGLSRPIMRGISYPMNYFPEVLPSMGFDNVEIHVFATKSNGASHPFVFAHKQT